MRIQTSTCTFGSQGTGFLVDDDLIVTAAHVVADAQVLRVINGSVSAAGEIVGYDEAKDVALIRSTVGFRGAHLRLSPKDPQIGDEVAALGYTLGDPLSFKPGAVNGLNRKATIDGIPRHGLIELDFAANHGNSGGPVIDSEGRVVGMVDAQTDIYGGDSEKTGEQQGDRLAIPPSVIRPLTSRWASEPSPPEPSSCDDVIGPDGAPIDASQFPTDVTQQAFQTLQIYFDAINQADYPTALSQLAKQPSLASFEKGVGSSQDSDFVVGSVFEESGIPVVWLQFTSNQDPGDGPKGREQETCTNWSLDYVFARSAGLWLIGRSRAHEGEPVSRPC